MENNNNSTTNNMFRKALTLGKGLAAALLGTFFLAGCDQLGDLDGVIPGGGKLMPGNNSKMKMYKVQLNPLNNSGVTGTATVMMKANGEFEVITDVMGLAPHMELDMMRSLQAYVFSSIAMHEAFIACWEEKYRTNRIRPITVINQHIDETWEPYLETPPFPEYVSGHSSISASAGVVLTHLFGDNVAFTDSTEYEFGHGVRSFDSIKDAYIETSMSRVYGGIHYLDGALEGTKQGEEVGHWVLSKLTGKPIEKDVTKQIAGK